MARGIIRKMIRGAAEAGVPMLQEQHRNNILQNRETAMARIQNQYRTQDREAEQSFTADQNAMDREQRTGEFEANRADAAEGRAIQREGLEIDRERLDQTAQQLAQTLEQGKFGIIEAQRLRGINDVITNPDSTPEQLDQAITMLQNLKNTDPDRYSFLKLSGGFDEPEKVVRANQRTGVSEIVNFNNSDGQGFSEEDIRAVLEANPQGTREQAIRYLEMIGRKSPN